MTPSSSSSPNSDQSAMHTLQQETQAAMAPRPERRFRTLLFQIYVVVAMILFALLALLALGVDYLGIDLAITLFIQRHAPAWFGGLLHGVSWIGYTPQNVTLVALMALALYILGLRWEALMTIFLSASSQLLNALIKLIIARPRPALDLVEVARELGDFSFPSGHVMFYVTLFGFLLFLSFTLLRTSALRVVLMGVLGLLVLLVGPSRVYLGEHWSSDVIAGYLLGSVLLLTAIRIYRSGKGRFFTHQPVAPER